MDKNEANRLMAIKAALVVTTNTPGWSYIKQIANNRVQKAVQEALDEEDSAKGETRRLKAKAMQLGFTDLFAAIEVTKAFNPNEADDAGFGELETIEREDS